MARVFSPDWDFYFDFQRELQPMYLVRFKKARDSGYTERSKYYLDETYMVAIKPWLLKEILDTDKPNGTHFISVYIRYTDPDKRRHRLSVELDKTFEPKLIRTPEAPKDYEYYEKYGGGIKGDQEFQSEINGVKITTVTYDNAPWIYDPEHMVFFYGENHGVYDNGWDKTQLAGWLAENVQYKGKPITRLTVDATGNSKNQFYVDDVMIAEASIFSRLIKIFVENKDITVKPGLDKLQ